MILWRLTRRLYADLSGRGGELFDARWHTRGRRVVYCATTAALAVLEVRVHLDLELDQLPDDYVLMKIMAPDELETQAIAAEDLSKGWQRDEELCRPLGDRWLAACSTGLLDVPSAVVQVERNVLLNPKHSDAKEVSVATTIPFGWDARLFTRPGES